MSGKISLLENYSMDSFFFGDGYDCYFTNDDGLYGYNFGTDKPEMLMNWENSVFNYITLSKVGIVSPKQIYIQ